jgi:hypothetical protein
MKTGDLVRIANEWVVHNPWMKEMFEGCITEIGLIVKDFGHNNHHCVVLIGGKEMNISKTRLEVVNG